MKPLTEPLTAPVRVWEQGCVPRQRGAISTALFACLLALASSTAGAQLNPSGSLLVTVNAPTTLTFAFENAPTPGALGTCAITGAGKTTTILSLGTASIAGDSLICVIFTDNAGDRSYTLGNSVYFNVSVKGASASYTLTAKLATAPTTGIAWTADSLPLSTTASTLTTTGTYGSTIPVSLTATVQGTVTTTAISQNIDIVATAN
jgi:hypothetical protein